MQCFLLPIAFSRELESLICKLRWRNLKSNKGIHWCSWKSLCVPKAFRGIGVKDFSCFNKALLAKQRWKLIIDPSSLLERVMKAKYYPR